MLKFVERYITFAEVPDEINLVYSISNCGGTCEGCHSPWLRKDEGFLLQDAVLKDIEKHKDFISCVCFLGEGNAKEGWKQEWFKLIAAIKSVYPNLKIALYSGRDTIDLELAAVLDYYKVGAYKQNKGPLTKTTTNQRMYKIVNNQMNDITYKFWRYSYEEDEDRIELR